MNTFLLAVTILFLVAIGLILNFGEFRVEYKIEKNKTDLNVIKKTSLDSLSNTELGILKLLAEGKTNQEIADVSYISVHTVKKHISNIFKKLKIKSRTEARKFKEFINSNIQA